MLHDFIMIGATRVPFHKGSLEGVNDFIPRYLALNKETAVSKRGHSEYTGKT